MFRVGDRVSVKGKHMWNITKVEGDRFWYDVIYTDRPNSPNTMVWQEWEMFSPRNGWALMERQNQLPEELFNV